MAAPGAGPDPDPWDRTAIHSGNQYLRHFPMKQQCGMCNGAVSANDVCVGLVGNDTTATLQTHTAQFLAPDAHDRTRSVNNWVLCARRTCKICDFNPDTTVLHHECFALWRHVAWRRPWVRMHCLPLPETSHIPLSALAVVAAKCGLAGLATLPQEILQVIRAHSASAHLWRYVAGLGLAAQLEEAAAASSRPDAGLYEISIRDVASWERGMDRPVETRSGSTPLPVLRIVVDAQGIQTVETLTNEDARYRHIRSDDRFFIVTETADQYLDGVTALFQDGLMRLRIPRAAQPPPLGPAHAPIFRPSVPLRDKTAPRVVHLQERGVKDSTSHSIDLTSVTGLTFLFANYIGLAAIHGHTAEKPHATIPHDITPNGLCWVYVPISKNDTVLSLDLRAREPNFYTQWPSLLLHTELTGLNIFGTFLKSEFPPPPRPPPLHALLHPLPHGHVIGMGTAARTRDPVKRPTPLSRPETIVPNFLAMDLLIKFSSAPLDAVRVATVFHHPDQPHLCLGIIFDYENGGSRAVGQCRLGHDATTVHHRPTRVCVRNVPQLHEGEPELQWTTKVAFSSGSDHSHESGGGGGGGGGDGEGDGDGMRCFSMKDSVLDFWFTAREFCIEIRRDNEAPGSSDWDSHSYAIVET
ncbi:unnamed protein product [Parascedosporium putredinis]|uniref:Uncharacterized protein n=1 Tax=Parascedosporium putredinis TaxID=1442378 RepID=A0A9P1M7Z7_9PEZI|nr:unnamed protein product [Parascedosporium putredinis]CAI7988183.1 unnamed protein product [Parascedosporium putredinis]